MTGKSFLDKFLRGGMVNAFGQTGGLTGLGPKVSYDATKGFVGSNPIVGGYAGQAAGGFGNLGRSLGSGVGVITPDLFPTGVVRGGNPSAGGLLGGGNAFSSGLLGNFFK